MEDDMENYQWSDQCKFFNENLHINKYKNIRVCLFLLFSHGSVTKRDAPSVHFIFFPSFCPPLHSSPHFLLLRFRGNIVLSSRKCLGLSHAHFFSPSSTFPTTTILSRVSLSVWPPTSFVTLNEFFSSSLSSL